MSLSKKKDSPYWYTRFSICGVRVQESTRCTVRGEAQEYENRRKREIRDQVLLGKKPRRSWSEAALRWCNEMNHKKSHQHDLAQLRWLQPRLERYKLDEINKSVLEQLALDKEANNCTGATINRMFNLIGAILRRAVKQWEWLEHMPNIPRRQRCDIKRERWITEIEAARLLKELPEHLRAMAKFSLATGLRASNVRCLKWEQVDLTNRHVSIHATESKNGRSFGVPLNQVAVDVIKSQMGKHDTYVFSYKGKHILKCSTKAWWNALKRAGIKDFRWHDLRHTWASWHVINGTSLYELKELGNWRSFEMVTRYAHLNSSRLKEAADRLTGAELVKKGLKVV